MMKRYVFQEGIVVPLNGGEAIAGIGSVTVGIRKDGNGWWMYVTGTVRKEHSQEKAIHKKYPTNSSTANYITRHGQEIKR